MRCISQFRLDEERKHLPANDHDFSTHFLQIYVEQNTTDYNTSIQYMNNQVYHFLSLFLPKKAFPYFYSYYLPKNTWQIFEKVVTDTFNLEKVPNVHRTERIRVCACCLAKTLLYWWTDGDKRPLHSPAHKFFG